MYWDLLLNQENKTKAPTCNCEHVPVPVPDLFESTMHSSRFDDLEAIARANAC